MNYILFFVYLLLCCWLLIKIPFIKKSGIGNKLIVGLFLLKVIMGVLNGWLSFGPLLHTTDTEMFHIESLKEYHLLFSHPGKYFSNIFSSGYSTGYAGFFASHDSYWNDLKSNLIIKLLSLFNIFSFGNYYTNAIFYNFLTFFGPVALYRIFIHNYTLNRPVLIFTCFLLPSLLFFSSCVHKEGLVFTAIGLLVYCIYYSLERKPTFFKVLISILCLAFIALQRNYVLIALFPALFAWIFVVISKCRPLLGFAIIYIIGAFLFFTIGKLSPALNLPQKIVTRQQDFSSLAKTASTIPSDSLSTNAKSFILATPTAFDHGILQPHIWQKQPVKYLLPFALEIFIYLLLLLLFLVFHRKDAFTSPGPVTCFSVFFGLSVLLIIGYIVPITGAIIRYRSIYLGFILTPLLCNIDMTRLIKFIRFKK